MARLDLLPGQAWVDDFEAAANLATPAQSRRLLGPPAAARGARLQVMMAREAQHEQVVLRIIAAPKDAQTVMNVELALEA